ncbi:LysR family transcriptional regulator [Novosphingobium pituita]|uniref:LysR family transcriptional regulator n=1 Tax=Novosphingobium pituita TaxID=3056842 RepID=A0ABQ6P2B4_9SPHN|nr:LysR family transcriptional regulator [Novosphingobium sp. IK01]GMM59393.1 LysR family transcriptional regulator [Novosphingobium sp. IK01]
MNLQDLAVFAEAVRSGSLAAAARRLGLNAMAASRRLAALETELGVRLVQRTTRALSPTAEGEAFLPHAQAMLDEQASALAALRPAGAGVSGQLRVTASAAFGRKVVAPMIARFMAANPDLGVDLLLTDDQVDIVAQGIDVAVRIAKLRDNHLVARRLADNPRRLCAAPAYIARHGKPRVLADLVDHACLLGTGGSHWVFVRNGKTVRQKVGGRFTASSIEALHQACIGGLGIANLSGWNVEDDLRAGVIEPIRLEDAEPEPLAIWAVYPTARLVPAKVRAFVGALEQELRGGEHRRA